VRWKSTNVSGRIHRIRLQSRRILKSRVKAGGKQILNSHWPSRWFTRFILNPEDGGDMFFRNVCDFQRTTRRYIPEGYVFPWEPGILAKSCLRLPCTSLCSSQITTNPDKSGDKCYHNASSKASTCMFQYEADNETICMRFTQTRQLVSCATTHAVMSSSLRKPHTRKW
jgi:hypothetical protein